MTKEENLLSLENLLYADYRGNPYEKLLLKSFESCNKIFLLLYDQYNSRFIEIYDKDLQFLWYYLGYIKYLRSLADEIILSLKLQFEKSKIKNLDKVIESANIFLAEDEKDFDKKIKNSSLNTDKKKNKKLSLGIKKNKIYEELNILLFSEVSYFLDIAENKNIVEVQIPEKYLSEARNSYAIYLDNQKLISKAKSISLAIGDPNYKSSSTDTLYKAVEKYFKLMDGKTQDEKEISEQIKKDLQNLT